MRSWWKREITAKIYIFFPSLRHDFGSDNLQSYKNNMTATNPQGVIWGSINEKQKTKAIPSSFSSSVKRSMNKCFTSICSMIVAISEELSIRQDRNLCMEAKMDLGKLP